MRRLISAWPAALLLVPAVAGCEQPADRTVIAVLTYGQDGALAGGPGLAVLRERVGVRCPECEVDVRPGGTRVTDLRAAVDDGADVVLVEALSADQGEELAIAAGSVPLVAFDRFFAGADYYVSYDRAAAGPEVAAAVAVELDDSAGALLVDGSSVDSDADVYEIGLRAALSDAGVDVVAEMRPTLGTADEARDWVSDQLGQRGDRAIGAVLTVSDAQASGAVAAVSGRPADDRPLVTGVGADLDAVRRVITGVQAFTVHLPVAQTAERAADVALSLASVSPGADLEGATEVEGVPAYVFAPVLVSRSNVTDAVVRDGTFTTGQLCRGDVAAVCRRLGIV